MKDEKRIKGTAKAWEDGKLGNNKAHIVEASDELEAALDASLAMKAISIRMPEDLIHQLKLIARYRGFGYQPLIRDIVQRFALSELRTILKEMEERQEIDAALSEEDSPAARLIREAAAD